MRYASDTLERLVQAFSRLPGIGEKSAQRIALYLLDEGREDGEALTQAITDVREKVRHCSRCFNIADEELCLICRDMKRDSSIICVVEEPKDLLAIERTGEYRGLYHVLGGSISPLDGVGEGDLHVRELVDRLKEGIREVILATNPTMEGEMTAAHLLKLLKPRGVKVTRIARGIPFGGALEFNDAVTVAKAMEGRTEL
jgi:recombination protein RecR